MATKNLTSYAVAISECSTLQYSELPQVARTVADRISASGRSDARGWDALTQGQRLAAAIDLDREELFNQAGALYWAVADLEDSISEAIKVSSTSAEKNALLVVLNRLTKLREENPAPTVDGREMAGEANELGERERGTLLKMIIGMAVAGYKYNPSDAHSPVTAEIVRDLEEAGVRVSDDTVRSKLKAGAALLPGRGKRTP